MTIQDLKELLDVLEQYPRVHTIRYNGVELTLQPNQEMGSEPGGIKEKGPSSSEGTDTVVDWNKLTLYDSPDAWPGGSKPVFHRKPPTDPDLK